MLFIERERDKLRRRSLRQSRVGQTVVPIMGKLFGALPSHVGNLVAGKVGVPLEAAHRPDGGQPGVVGGRVHVPPGDLAARAQRPRPAGDLGGGQDQRGALEGGAGELLEAIMPGNQGYDYFCTL